MKTAKKKDVSKLVFTTDYHRLRVLITNDGKFTLCYSVSSVVSSDTPSF